MATDWQITAPVDAGFAPDVEARLDEAFRAGELPNLHAALAARDGKLFLERYYPGEDERWGTSLGHVEHGPEVRHDLRSVSKSVVSLLYGIALEKGLVPALDTPLVDQFPQYSDLARDPERRRITVAHALTMTMGTEWDESIPYDDPRNSEIAMEMADDRYRFVLDRPIVTEPGAQWVYNGGATALLAYLVAEGSGQHLLEFAHEHLFAPLGIIDVEWVEGFDGEPAAASGLRMRAADLLKIGQLILNDGRWNGQELVPAGWLEASFTQSVPAEDELRYGYQWWLGRGGRDGRAWMAGFGNGGQRLVVIPDLDLAIVVFAGNYNQREAWRVPVSVIGDILFPALRDE